jgi:hypothetical protein
MSSFRDTALVGRALLAGLAACALAACSDDNGPTTNTPGPLAYVRVINAIPDTQTILYKFTDRLENPLDANGVGFRGASAYQGHAPGQRQFRAFMLNPGASFAIASGAPLIDQSITLRPDQYYTIIHYGRANRNAAGAAIANGDSLLILEDSIPTNATLGNNIGIRVIHMAAGVAGVDVFATRRATDALPATPLLANFGYLRVSGNSYPTRVPADSLAARARVVAAPTIVLSQQAPDGIPGTDQQNPLTGVRTPGATFSVIAFPAPTPTTQGVNIPVPAGQTAAQVAARDTLPILRWFVDQRAANTQPIARN